VITDRHRIVPPGHVIVTGYVSIWDIELVCRDRMAVGDVDAAFRRLLQLGEDSMWPCPNGYWQTGQHGRKFIISDGRHEYIATIMIGRKYILCAWTEPVKPVHIGPPANLA
jgi:hypothetical protein